MAAPARLLPAARLTMGPASLRACRVVLARDRVQDRAFAVKLLRKSLLRHGVSTTGCQVLESATREVEVLRRLRAAPHPNTLGLAEGEALLEDDARMCVVLPFADQGDLFNLVARRGPLPERMALDFFRQILQGLAHLHHLGYCHRDLSLENVLLFSDPAFPFGMRAVLADYGLVEPCTTAELLRTVAGKVGFMAPEVMQRRPHNGHAADVFSLGPMLFTMLFGGACACARLRGHPTDSTRTPRSASVPATLPAAG